MLLALLHSSAPPSHHSCTCLTTTGGRVALAAASAASLACRATSVSTDTRCFTCSMQHLFQFAASHLPVPRSACCLQPPASTTASSKVLHHDAAKLGFKAPVDRPPYQLHL